jgi:predicted metal-dependent hydrolase
MQEIELNGITVEVVRKKIKQVHLSVNPPTGKVRISAPAHVHTDVLRAWALTRMTWIKRQRSKMEQTLREPPLRYVQLETHYAGGRACLLYITERPGRTEVKLNHDRLELYIRPGSTTAQREKAIDVWHRSLLREQLPALISRYEKLLQVKVHEVGIKRMKTRWGTCNPKARRIWINAELAKKPLRSLEYIVAHEMAHLVEPSHNARFRNLLNQLLPDWPQRKRELGELPIGV